MSKWQPIATAPKDSTRILVAREGQPICWIAWWTRYVDVAEQYWVTDTGPYEPTHWIPLPDPPAVGDPHE